MTVGVQCCRLTNLDSGRQRRIELTRWTRIGHHRWQEKEMGVAARGAIQHIGASNFRIVSWSNCRTILTCYNNNNRQQQYKYCVDATSHFHKPSGDEMVVLRTEACRCGRIRRSVSAEPN